MGADKNTPNPRHEESERQKSKEEESGKFACIVELSEHKEFNNREEAEQFANKMRADMENDAAFKRFKIGRAGVKRLD